MPQSPPCIATPSVLDAFRRREPSAMRALYRDYGRLVYAVALRVLGRADLIRAIKTLGPDASVADAMSSQLPVIGHRATLEQALKLLQDKSAPAVGVTDRDGKLVGLVTNETIAEMMMLKESLPKGVKLGPWSRPAGV